MDVRFRRGANDPNGRVVTLTDHVLAGITAVKIRQHPRSFNLSGFILDPGQILE